MTAGRFSVSSVPKQTYGLLQSRKPVWKSTSRREPERIHVSPQSELLQCLLAHGFSSRNRWPERQPQVVGCPCGVLGQVALWHREVGIAINSGCERLQLFSRQHPADAWLGRFASSAARALRRSRCNARGSRSSLGWKWTATSGGSATCRGRALWRDQKPSLRLVGSGCGFSQAPSASARLCRKSPHTKHREPWLRRAGNPACRLHRTS